MLHPRQRLIICPRCKHLAGLVTHVSHVQTHVHYKMKFLEESLLSVHLNQNKFDTLLPYSEVLEVFALLFQRHCTNININQMKKS